MKPCIYCSRNDPSRFSGREHVIQQAFGTFGANTPTLNCVCDNCNAHFARELDQFLARETWEGVTRYKNAKFSSRLLKKS
jgi:HNH endonuclease